MALSTKIEESTQDIKLPRQTFLLFCPDREFVVPYLERQLGEEWHVVTRLSDTDLPDRVAMLSSTDIYAVDEGLNYDESTAVDPESSWYANERLFEGYCRQRSLHPIIVRCANIVGTGMNGLPMDLARGIHRGTLRHIATPRSKHETRLNRGKQVVERPKVFLSVIHAVDVALIVDILTSPGRINNQIQTAYNDEIYNLSDNTLTNIDELIDALAYRINNKQVTSASPFWTRMFAGRRVYHALTHSLTFNPAKILRVAGFTPHEVTQYLRTHTYDESSL